MIKNRKKIDETVSLLRYTPKTFVKLFLSAAFGPLSFIEDFRSMEEKL